MTERTPDDIIAGLPSAARLTAHVVDDHDAPRIHGYSVHHDLARHYSFAECVLTTLRGSPPDEHEGHAFGVVLTFLMPHGVGEAPTHSAVLCRLLGAAPRNVVSVAAVTLTDQALAGVAGWQAALDRTEPTQPDAADVEAVAALRLALGAAESAIPELARDDLTLGAAMLAVLRFCGLREPWQLACAIVLARLPATCAEAQHHGPEHLRDYPMNVPPFVYEEDRGG